MILLYIFLGILSMAIIWIAFYAFCSILVDTSKEYTENSSFYRFVINSAAVFAMLFLRIKLSVRGKEKLDKNQNYLFVSNHRSNLDPILTWYAFKEHKIAFVSKPENFKAPIFGRIIHRCCFLPINRNDPFKAIECINKASELLKKRTMSVGIYPEGTRNTKNELLPFHNGTLKIAQKSKTPIVVLAIKNTDKVNHNIPFKRTKISIEVLSVLSVEEILGQRTNVVGDKIKDIIEQGLK